MTYHFSFYDVMETLVYHLNSSELTTAFLENARRRIDTERVIVTIAPEATIHSAFEEKIMSSLKDPITYSFQSDELHDEFEEFSSQLLSGNSIDNERYKQIRE